MKIRPVFAWYDLWLGVYWDRKLRCLYAMIPMFGICVEFGRRPQRGLGIMADALGAANRMIVIIAAIEKGRKVPTTDDEVRWAEARLALTYCCCEHRGCYCRVPVDDYGEVCPSCQQGGHQERKG